MPKILSTREPGTSSLPGCSLETAAPGWRSGNTRPCFEGGVWSEKTKTKHVLRNMKKLNLLMIGVALTLPTLSHAAINRGIIGSPHDFSTNYWAFQYNSHRVCEVCHAVHQTDPNQIAPLWSHATTTNSFIPYNNTPGQYTGTQDSTPAAPGGVSLACLSCHDGTVGLNQTASGGFMGTSNAVYIAPQWIIPENGNDLHTTHPISIIYDTALSTLDGGLEDPMTYTIGAPKTR